MQRCERDPTGVEGIGCRGEGSAFSVQFSVFSGSIFSIRHSMFSVPGLTVLGLVFTYKFGRGLWSMVPGFRCTPGRGQQGPGHNRYVKLLIIDVI